MTVYFRLIHVCSGYSMLGLVSSGYAMLRKVMSVYFIFCRVRPCKFRLGNIMSFYNISQVM